MLNADRENDQIIQARNSKTPEEFEQFIEEYAREREERRRIRQEIAELTEKHRKGTINLEILQEKISIIEKELSTLDY